MAQIRHFKCNTQNIPAGVWLLIHLLKLTEIRLMKLQEHVKDMIGKNNPVIIQPSANLWSYLWSQHPFWYIRYFPVYCTYTHNMCLPVFEDTINCAVLLKVIRNTHSGKTSSKNCVPCVKVAKWIETLSWQRHDSLNQWIFSSSAMCLFWSMVLN